MHRIDAAKASKRPTKSVKQEASGKASNKNRPTKTAQQKPPNKTAQQNRPTKPPNKTAQQKTRRGVPRRASSCSTPVFPCAARAHGFQRAAIYFAFSAELLMALPPFEMSWPAPAIVLQPASAAVPAMRSKAISRFMDVLLVEGYRLTWR
jgi:hypothetical protein